jgi:class 3 adenylate cyclase
MAAFRTAQEAVDCGKQILTGLDEFNKNVSTISDPFRVRMGANTGEVNTDDTTPMVKISDFSVDLAGHMQKYARPDTIWISEKTYQKLDNTSGFKKTDETVDDRTVYEWEPSTTENK